VPGAIATAYVELRGDDQHLRRDVRRSGEDAGSEAGGGFTRTFGRALVGIGATLATGKFFTESVTGASDLGESLNAVNKVFKDSADEVNALGSTAADRLGLTETQFNAAAVSVSAFAKTIAGDGGDVAGVVDEMSTRAADFASVMNLEGGANEALALFRSGLAGETEPLRRFGLDLSAATVESYAYANGIAAQGEELTEAQKQQARYALLLEQTQDSAGDFADTQDSMANALRRVKANASEAATSFGQGLLPAVEDALGSINETLLSIEEPLAEVGEAVGEALTPLIEAIGPAVETALEFLPGLLENIGTVLGSLAPLVEPIVALLGEVASVIGGALAAGFEALAPVIEVVAGFIGDFADLIGDSLGPIIEDLAPVLEDIGEILAEVFAEAAPVILELFEALMPVIETIAEIAGDVLLVVLEGLAEVFGTLMEAIRPLIPVLQGALLRIFNALKPVLPTLANALVQIAVAFAEILVALSPLIPPLVDLVATLVEELGVPVLLAISEALVVISEAFAALAPIITDLVEGPLTDAINWVTEFIQESPIVQEIIGGIVDAFQDFATFVQEAVDVVKAIFEGDWGEAWQQFQELAGAALEVFLGLWDDLGPLVLEGLRALWDNFIFPFLRNLPGLILQGLSSLGSLLLQTGRDLLDGLWDGIQAIWEDPVRPWIEGLPDTILGLLEEAGDWLLDVGADILNTLWFGIQTVWTTWIEPFFADLPDTILGLLKEAGDWLLDTGADILNTLWFGIQSIWINYVEPFFADLPDTILGLLTDAGSWLLSTGSNLLQGLWDGINGIWTILEGWFIDLGDTILGLIGDLGGWLVGKGSDLLQGLWDGINGIWTIVKGFFTDLPETIVGLIGEVGGMLLAKGSALMQSLWDGINGIWTIVKEFFADLPSTLANLIITVGSGLWSKGQDIMLALQSGLDVIWRKIVDAFTNIPSMLADLIVAVGSGLWTKGQELLLQLWAGIDVIWKQVKDWALGVPGQIGGWVVETAGDLLAKGGELISNLVQGIIDWVERNIPGAGWLIERLGLALSEEDGRGAVRPAGVGFIFELEEQIRGGAPAIEEATGALAQGGVTAFQEALGELSSQLIPDVALPQSEVDAFVSQFAELGTPAGDALAAAVAVATEDGVLKGAEWDNLQAVFNEQLDSTASGMGEHAAAAFGPVGAAIMGSGIRGGAEDEATSNTKPYLEGLPDQFVTWLGATTDVFRLSGAILIDGLREGMTERRDSKLVPELKGLPLRIIAAVGDLNSVLVNQAHQLMNGFLLGVANRWAAVQDWLNGVWLRAVQAVGNLSSILVNAGHQLMSGLLLGIGAAWPNVAGWLHGVWLRAIQTVGDLDWVLVGRGHQLMAGLLNGLVQWWPNVASWIRGLPGRLSSALGSLSNTWFDEGAALMNGFMRGARSAVDRLTVSVPLFFEEGGLVPGRGPVPAIVHGGELILTNAQAANLGANVLRWAGTASSALGLAGQSVRWIGDLLTQMKHESGGNPFAVNRWDINWLLGHPSMGLMQVIAPTFRAYAGSLLERGILDPLANIFAAIRYTVDRYGTLGAWRARGFRGYAEGGMVPGRGPQLAVVHGGELVLTPQQQAGMGGINVYVGPLTFAGALPTDMQALQIGRQIGRGVEEQLLQQRIRTTARVA
jgi:phage-related protein